MLHFIISVTGILITIFFVVGTHEFAHFAAARLAGVKVLRFSIGFGKKILGWRGKTGTEYIIALIPLGGYVKMLDENEGKVETREKRLAFNRQPYYKKFFIVAAGPLTNICCALVLYWLIFMIGFTTLKPLIGTVNPHSIAEAGGLKSNQEIIKVDDKKIVDWGGFILRLIVHAGNQDTIKIETSNENNIVRQHILNLESWRMDNLTPDPLGSIGILPLLPKAGPHFKMQDKFLRKIQYPPQEAFVQALRQIYNFTYFNFLLIGKLVTGKLSLQSLAGL